MKFLNTLYLVDDDVMYQYIAKRTIQSTGLVSNISVFSNGLEAFEALQSNQSSNTSLPDMILLDLMMPVLDGWGFLKNFEQLKPQLEKPIEIYILSSSFNPIDIDRAKNISDVKGYVVKPITTLKFGELIEKSGN